jgi:hypothetical protein
VNEARTIAEESGKGRNQVLRMTETSRKTTNVQIASKTDAAGTRNGLIQKSPAQGGKLWLQ